MNFTQRLYSTIQDVPGHTAREYATLLDTDTDDVSKTLYRLAKNKTVEGKYTGDGSIKKWYPLQAQHIPPTPAPAPASAAAKRGRKPTEADTTGLSIKVVRTFQLSINGQTITLDRSQAQGLIELLRSKLGQDS